MQAGGRRFKPGWLHHGLFSGKFVVATMQVWKIKIAHAGTVYRDEGPFEEVMARLQAACSYGKLIEAIRSKEAKVEHILAELDAVEGKASERGANTIAEMARDLRRHVQAKRQVEMRDADALSFLQESLSTLEVA